MENLFEILENRATCRNFETRDIPDDVMERLYKAACTSASAGGFQRISIIAVRDPAAKKELARLSRNQGFISKAPVNLIFCFDNRRTMRIAQHECAPYETGRLSRLWMGIVDAVIAAQTLALAAEALGLASCYNGNVIERAGELGPLLNLPQQVVPAIMLTLGYPKAKTRRRLSPKYGWQVFVHDEKYTDMPIDALCEAHEEKCGKERYPLTDARLEKLRNTAERQFGAKYAEECIERARQEGSLSAFQYWFGCYYAEEEGYSRAFLDFLKEQGYPVGEA